MIPVTKPFLPEIADYKSYIDKIFKKEWLTNNGPLVNSFELKLKEYLKVDHLLFVSNGTIALQLAIKSLDLKGEIITTPFSYVATTSSIVWEGCKPVYVDIDDQTLNIDPDKIEDAITDKTSAILATHCFGNACDIDAIDLIAKKHNLKVIYDAAHCFGTTYKGRSIFEYGDISTCSLHATKLMHSTEGGLIFTKNADLIKKHSYLRNFGHDGIGKFNGIGINGKNSEFHAAMGLCVLKSIDEILASRKSISEYYNDRLEKLEAYKPEINSKCKYNFAYYPIIFSSEQKLVGALKMLNKEEIFPRRYFYPSLNKLDYVSGKCEVSEDVSQRILCLPLYNDLMSEEQDYIVRLLLRSQNY